MAKYKQRISDRILKRKVLGKGAVLIEGPKWCGKDNYCQTVGQECS